MIVKTISARKEEQFTTHCDKCQEPTPQKNFGTAGDAADLARRSGFITKFRDDIHQRNGYVKPARNNPGNERMC